MTNRAATNRADSDRNSELRIALDRFMTLSSFGQPEVCRLLLDETKEAADWFAKIFVLPKIAPVRYSGRADPVFPFSAAPR